VSFLKLRNGFVSNSSTSSFICIGWNLFLEELLMDLLVEWTKSLDCFFDGDKDKVQETINLMKYQPGFAYKFFHQNNMEIEGEYKNIIGVMIDTNDVSADNFMEKMEQLNKRSINNKLMNCMDKYLNNKKTVLTINYRNG
jgi:hypothetical protein